MNEWMNAWITTAEPLNVKYIAVRFYINMLREIYAGGLS